MAKKKNMSKRDCKLILALDLPDRESALKILDGLRGKLEWVKIGLQMYLKYGADFVREGAGDGVANQGHQALKKSEAAGYAHGLPPAGVAEHNTAAHRHGESIHG